MIEVQTSRRFIVGEESRPTFSRYARLREDRARGRWVILAPERVYEVDAISVAILKLCDGRRASREIVAELAAVYAAPAERIARDVIKLLQGLADKRLLRDGPDGFAPRERSALATSYEAFSGGPTGLLAELTHRCPLQCPYCSNPLELERASAEMSAEAWGDIFRQAAAMGVMQLHLSGGEPTARRDLDQIVAHAVEAGLYTNLVTAGVLLTRDHLARLAQIGLDHVQVSVQDVDTATADRVSGYRGGVAKKRDVARWAGELGLGLTVNAPIHRENIDHLPAIIDFALELDAQRIEVAHIQFYAWAERNRAALIPTREKFLASAEIVEEARTRLAGVLNFDFVLHDHYSMLPKACMGGWAKSIVVVTPSGKVLPCHAAQSCYRREVDFGGCRCQAFAVTGDAAAADPTCHLSPAHGQFVGLATAEAHVEAPAFVYRRMGAGAEA
jgi:pyrroloquinoline quinone biosynthesis protein E